jgi:hypothetical protein
VQGWQREARGRYIVLEDREIRRAPTLEPTLRQPTTLGRDFENQTGQKSAQRVAIELSADLMRRARRWDELHLLLADRGMRFERKGSGAVLWIGDVAVKASIAGRDCSLSALEKRLGDFTPARDRTPTKQLAPEPIEPAVKQWKTYAVERHRHYTGKTQQWELLRTQQRDRWKEQLVRHREERQKGLGGNWRGKGLELNALRSMLAARQAQEKAALRERQQLEREILRERFPKWLPFEEWLRARGAPELADEWRFRDRTPAGIAGDREDLARPRDIRAFAAEARGWEVRYYRAREQGRAPCFSDRGREIRIHDLGRDSVLAALQLSAQKWGTFHVFGSESYKSLCVELAAEHGFRITNPELQNEIALERGRRQHLERARPLEHFRPPTPTRAPLRDIAEAYRKDLDEVRRSFEGKRVDMSRMDARVAVHLRARGFDRGEVERAIRTEAAKLRPMAGRDWDAYAKRAIGHAFGKSGELELKRILGRDARLSLDERSRSLARKRGLDLGR